MVIKLRKFRTGIVIRVSVFLLAVITITSAIVLYMVASIEEPGLESILVKDYTNSDEFIEEAAEVLSQVIAVRIDHRVLTFVPFTYYLKDNETEYTNSEYHDESYLSKSGMTYFILSNAIWKNNRNDKEITVHYFTSKEVTGYVAYDNDYMIQQQRNWDNRREQVISYIISAIILAFLGLLSIIFLLSITMRRNNDAGPKSKIDDILYTDIIFILFIFVSYLFANNFHDILQDNSSVGIRISNVGIEFLTDFRNQFMESQIFIFYILIIFISVILSLLLILIRGIKKGHLIENSLSYKIINILKEVYTYFKIYKDNPEAFKTLSITKKLYYRQLLMITSTVILIALIIIFTIYESPLFLFPLIIEMIVLHWYTKGNELHISEIATNIQTSLREQMKSERMKVALITNVSHDLKTPLTSIISYVDLLSKEENLSETAKDYINILQSKSNRLKNIVTDLFELAKSTSGDINLDFEVLDLKKLMEQTLGEMEDKVTASGLQVKTKLPDTQLSIRSDGKRLYRVFQNVIENSLKYSLKGTRIYIELEEINNRASASIKNIAGYEMNFTVEEIMQRFTRGDEARTEDGSGLGLSIAESFTKVCGGDFKIEIDGDLFKVNISFPLVSEV